MRPWNDQSWKNKVDGNLGLDEEHVLIRIISFHAQNDLPISESFIMGRDQISTFLARQSKLFLILDTEIIQQLTKYYNRKLFEREVE